MTLSDPDPKYGPGKSSYVKSDLAQKLYGCETTHFDATSFHLHNPSEHTVGGIHRDIAMHVVQYVPERDTKVFKLMAIAIQFSVDNYDRTDLTE